MTWLPDPILTERLILRPMRPDDEEQIAVLFWDDEVRRYLGGALPLDAARRRAAVAAEGATERFWGHFAVVERSSDGVIGMAGLDDMRGVWQLNYEFRPQWWGRGLATEASIAVMEWFWSQRPDVREVTAVTQVANERSCRLLARLGAIGIREFVEFEAMQREYVLRRSPAAEEG